MDLPMVTKKPKIRCRTASCHRFAVNSKNLCASCYQNARSLVLDKKTTWQELEELGLCSPKRVTPFLAAFAKAKEAKAKSPKSKTSNQKGLSILKNSKAS